MDDPLPSDLCEHWAAFFAREGGREPGRNVYDEVFDAPKIFPLQRKRELAYMMQLARGMGPRVVFEIGADKAGGLYHWCESLPTVERVICCEIRGTPYRHLFESAFPHIEFLWLPVSSYASDTIAEVGEWLGKDTIDCLFIDGDKGNFDGDFFAYRDLMSTPAKVFMHDIQDEAPRRGYDEVITHGYRHSEFIDTTESAEAAVRESQGIPEASAHEQWLRVWHGRSAGVGVIHIDAPKGKS